MVLAGKERVILGYTHGHIPAFLDVRLCLSHVIVLHVPLKIIFGSSDMRGIDSMSIGIRWSWRYVRRCSFRHHHSMGDSP